MRENPPLIFYHTWAVDHGLGDRGRPVPPEVLLVLDGLFELCFQKSRWSLVFLALEECGWRLGWGCRIRRRMSLSRISWQGYGSALTAFELLFSAKVRWSPEWVPISRIFVSWWRLCFWGSLVAAYDCPESFILSSGVASNTRSLERLDWDFVSREGKVATPSPWFWLPSPRFCFTTSRNIKEILKCCNS